MKNYTLLFLLFVSFTSMQAQSLLRRADLAYETENYRYAADAYQKYCDKDDELDAKQTIPLANSYFYLKEYDKAKKYYEISNEKKMTPLDWFNYAELLRSQKLYREAIVAYQTGQKKRSRAVPANRFKMGIIACEWALRNYEKKHTKEATLKPSGIDVAGQSYGVSPYDGGVVYSSAEPSNKKKDHDALGRPVLKLSYSADSALSNAVAFAENLASSDNVGSVEFSADGETMYYTKAVEVNGVMRLKLFEAHLDHNIDDWAGEQELSFCTDAYNYAHPALSLDGNTLYFASDMRGTKGGMDIYKVQKKGDFFGKPQNMGPVINTAATEAFPYITPNGTLSFASDGHPGFGGLDAFWVVMEDGTPVEIMNALRPINSSYDDFAAVVDPSDTLRAYLSSNRETEGLLDEVYVVEMTEDYMLAVNGVNVDSLHEVARQDSILRSQMMLDSMHFDLGIVNTAMVDGLSFTPLHKASYQVMNIETGEMLLNGITDKHGEVTLDLKSAEIRYGQPLLVVAIDKKSEFSSFSAEILSHDIKASSADDPLILIPIMAKRDKVKHVIVADEVVTQGAPFGFDSAELTPAGEQYLDIWAEFLLKNLEVTVKLMTHTDSRGNVAYNFKLSQHRAYQAKQYLLSKGVNHIQVISRGYGERYPVVDCKECSEEDHDANRRIEIEVINKQ